MKIQNLIKKYKGINVINNITLTIEEPGLYIIYGQNGSGKTTLIKIIASIIYKTSGDFNNDFSISYLPDKFSLPLLQKAKDYIQNILKLYQINYDAKLLMEEYKIPNKKIKELSKGNLQKIGLLQTFIKDTDCYIFDEPLDGLDDFAKKLFKEMIIKKLNDKKILIISMHNKNSLLDLKPNIFVMKGGDIFEKKKKV